MIDDLAQITARGFASMDKRFENTASKKDMKEISDRLDRIEFSQGRRIEILEDKVRIIAEKIGLRK